MRDNVRSEEEVGIGGGWGARKLARDSSPLRVLCYVYVCEFGVFFLVRN